MRDARSRDGADANASEVMTQNWTHCPVCEKELKPWQVSYCSSRCANLARVGRSTAESLETPTCRWVKSGHTRSGQQRLRCESCSDSHYKYEGEKPETKTDRKRRLIAEALAVPGTTARSIEKALGISNASIRRMMKQVERPACPCGAPAGHCGWCSYRFEQSPARQKFIKEWHRQRRKTW